MSQCDDFVGTVAHMELMCAVLGLRGLTRYDAQCLAMRWLLGSRTQHATLQALVVVWHHTLTECASSPTESTQTILVGSLLILLKHAR